MELTYYGHSCFSVTVAGKKLLFDPFITYNDLAKHIDKKSIEADFIFVSHGHEDHIADLLELAEQTQATVVSNWEICAWINKNGYAKTHPMNHGGSWYFDFGKVKCVNAVHSSGLPDGSYGGTAMGFVFTTEEGNFYYSGDTALTLDMQLVPLFASLQFAVLPIGDNFTMDASDAEKAAGFVQCNTVVGVHYDTFGYIKVDKEKAQKLFTSKGKSLLLPAIGETITV